MSLTAPEQPAQGQDPQAQVAAPAAPVYTPPAPGAGPWDADLQLTFDDPNVRSKVDAFMRSKVQPRMTQLEQQVAGSRDASTLWNDLRDRPNDTFVAIAGEMYGEKGAEAVLTALQTTLQATEAVQGTPATAEQTVAAMPAEMQQVLAYVQEKQATEQYDSAMAQVLTDRPDILPDNLHPFVAAASGNFNAAIAMHDQYVNNLLSSRGITPEQLGQVPTPAPPVMGSDTGSAAPASTPVEPQHQTLDGAIRDMVNEWKTNKDAPPVMG